MDIIIDVKTRGTVKIRLKQAGGSLCEESLTISQDFDNMLIRTLDKLLANNRIDRLLIKSVKIAGKMDSAAISAMIVSTIKNALKI